MGINLPDWGIPQGLPISNRRLIYQCFMAASFGLLFAGVSALAGYMGLNEKAMAGVGVGLAGAGLALSIAAIEFLRQEPPRRDRDHDHE